MLRDSKAKGGRAEYRRRTRADHADKQEVADAPRNTATITQCSKTFPWTRNYPTRCQSTHDDVCHEGKLPINGGYTWTGKCTTSAEYYTSNFKISDTNTRYFLKVEFQYICQTGLKHNFSNSDSQVLLL